MEDQYYQAVGAVQYQDGTGGVDELIWGAFQSVNSIILDTYVEAEGTF